MELKYFILLLFLAYGSGTLGGLANGALQALFELVGINKALGVTLDPLSPYKVVWLCTSSPSLTNHIPTTTPTHPPTHTYTNAHPNAQCTHQYTLTLPTLPLTHHPPPIPNRDRDRWRVIAGL